METLTKPISVLFVVSSESFILAKQVAEIKENRSMQFQFIVLVIVQHT